ncbi:UNVERIFIED_CONTAM: hypothetical protein K2H54_027350 [Gekko kuhli]
MSSFEDSEGGQHLDINGEIENGELSVSLINHENSDSACIMLAVSSGSDAGISTKATDGVFANFSLVFQPLLVGFGAHKALSH